MAMTRRQYLQMCARRRREMKKLREAEWTLGAIGKKYGISYQAVQSALKRA